MTAREIAIVIAANLRAAWKRFIAWLRSEPLVDLRLLPDDLRAAIRPLVRPTVRYLTVPQTQRLIEAACALMVSYERLYHRHVAMAKTEAALGVANAMAALTHQPAELLPRELDRVLAADRRS